MKREDLRGEPVMFYVDVLEPRWHRVDIYTPDARCACPGQWSAVLSSRVASLTEDTWKFATPEEMAPCASAQATPAAPPTPWTPSLGERVVLVPEAVPLYEDGTPCEWFVEETRTGLPQRRLL